MSLVSFMIWYYFLLTELTLVWWFWWYTTYMGLFGWWIICLHHQHIFNHSFISHTLHKKSATVFLSHISFFSRAFYPFRHLRWSCRKQQCKLMKKFNYVLGNFFCWLILFQNIRNTWHQKLLTWKMNF